MYSITFWEDCIIELCSSIRRLVKSDNGTCKRVSMGLTDRRKTAKNLVDSGKY